LLGLCLGVFAYKDIANFVFSPWFIIKDFTATDTHTMPQEGDNYLYIFYYKLSFLVNS